VIGRRAALPYAVRLDPGTRLPHFKKKVKRSLSPTAKNSDLSAVLRRISLWLAFIL
jgi:hypothetical protein